MNFDNNISYNDTTIAAISTPLGEGGVAVIRISGSEAIAVADKVFRTASGCVSSMKANTVKYGSVIDENENILDTGLITVFLSPHSYTGEDTAEISCHGGVVSIREVLRAVVAAGASLALAGEFTKRAFLNGKLSLTQAEAVIDMITAKNHQALQAARGQLGGALATKIDAVCDGILKISGGIAAWIDYPEEDIEEVERDTLIPQLLQSGAKLDELIQSFNTGKMLREGINTVIVGKPNVGKSSLMNLLSGCEKSIVTDVAGTTRDVIEEYVNVDGIPLLLCDTAGIHSTTDTVEKIGVERAIERLSASDLLIAVFDCTQPFDFDDREILEKTKVFNTNTILVLNKSDLASKNQVETLRTMLSEYNKSPIVMSAANGEGVQTLNAEILRAVGLYNLSPEAGILANERQRESAVSAKAAINSALEALYGGVTLDAVEVLLEDAISALLTLSGKRVTETIVDQVFSKFCVGK